MGNAAPISPRGTKDDDEAEKEQAISVGINTEPEETPLLMTSVMDEELVQDIRVIEKPKEDKKSESRKMNTVELERLDNQPFAVDVELSSCDLSCDFEEIFEMEKNVIKMNKTPNSHKIRSVKLERPPSETVPVDVELSSCDLSCSYAYKEIEEVEKLTSKKSDAHNCIKSKVDLQKTTKVEFESFDNQPDAIDNELSMIDLCSNYDLNSIIDFQSTLTKVIATLDSKENELHWKLKEWSQLNDLISQMGPQLKVLHWRKLEQIGRIPQFSENQTISLEQANTICVSQGLAINIVFFSHRWFRPKGSPPHPDDVAGSKAQSMVRLGKYNLDCFQNETFYFIDYSCIDQDNPFLGMAMLPLYVIACDSGCAGLACYDSEGYDDRAWTRLERIMWAALNSPRQWRIMPSTVEQSPWTVLQDPTKGKLTHEEDRPFINDLTQLCHNIWGKFWKTQDCESWGVNRNELVLGETSVATWRI